MIELVVVVLAALAAAAYVARPLLRSAPARIETPVSDAHLRKEHALEAILDLEAELAAGKISPDDHAAFKVVHEREALAALRELDVAAAAEDDALETEIAAVKARLR